MRGEGKESGTARNLARVSVEEKGAGNGGGGEDIPGTAYSHTAYSLSAEHLDESWQGVFEGEFKKPYFNNLQVRTPHHPDLVRSLQL